ncbi:hypothetical protein SDC9_90293 [bioreactor metagenome]|uniref:Uncharacterized protein n=1 Tax=bioreactor metagenome TaxID=1076179 RepID=A0A644ZS87_9ZZZZ
MEVKLHHVGLRVHRHGAVLGAVFDDALVVIGPVFFEQRALGGHVLVGVQDQHLRLGFVLLEVMRHLAGALVRAGRAAVRCFGDGDGVDAAVAHGFELLAQRHGFGTGLPGLQDGAALVGGLQPLHAAPHQLDAGRQDELVVGQRLATRKLHGLFLGVDGLHPVFHAPHAVARLQRVVAPGDVADHLAATQHQVGQRARDELLLRLHQHHVDLLRRKHAHILGRRGTAKAAAHHNHLGLAGARGLRAACATRQRGQRSQSTYRGRCLQKFTSLHDVESFVTREWFRVSARRSNPPASSSADRSAPWQAGASPSPRACRP